ncbi:CpsD/CapB family tyrosine-protein kinase [Loktanella sp. Alg231-35]|uniref:CpsD/CapB family tyrosine-protein kinase n=1 Tax=Loktanella sp. Alg231-35 TaxID=1922220 RepID=UPI000D558EB6|nr:CpsD/CapB family tyrosine-protein kinase [Loktanella sp. Alg231-35]
MERIREAIEKARHERQSAGTQRQGQAGTGGASPVDGTVTDDWISLPQFDVNPKSLRRNRIMTLEANPHATPFDVMRTKLLHEMRSKNWRRVAFTSPGTDCGKSTVVLNLAFSLARQTDLRVMVIELDFRTPSIARMLQLDDGTNFAKVLSGTAQPRDHIKRYKASLAVAASKDTPNSAELLHGTKAAHVIDAIEAQYQPDVMLFDMPPVLVADDTMAFIDQVDATLLIGAAEASTLDEIGRCKQELETRTNLLGVVLNKCRYPETS